MRGLYARRFNLLGCMHSNYIAFPLLGCHMLTERYLPSQRMRSGVLIDDVRIDLHWLIQGTQPEEKFWVGLNFCGVFHSFLGLFLGLYKRNGFTRGWGVESSNPLNAPFAYTEGFIDQYLCTMAQFQLM